jgi:pyruvate dehydrogenase E2 component (dihydrolipoamide acetyltransferase)
MKETLNGIAFCLAALGFSVAACGGGSSSEQPETAPAATNDPAATPQPAAPAEAAGPAHLKFAEMTVSEGTRPIFKIHADGKTEVAGAGGAWAEGPAVTADGTITFKQQQVARIEADGTIKNLRNGQVIPVKVGPDTLSAQGPGGEVKFQITEDGTIAVPGAPPEKNLKVEGAADAETRRTALALIGAIFLSGKAQQQPAEPAQPSGQAQPAPAQPAPAQPAPTKPK